MTYGCINIQAGRTSRKLLPSDKGSVQSARIGAVRPVPAWMAAFFEIDAVFQLPRPCGIPVAPRSRPRCATVSQGRLRDPRRHRRKQTPKRCPHRDSQATTTKAKGAREVCQDQARKAHRPQEVCGLLGALSHTVRTPSQAIRLLPDGGVPPDEPAPPEPRTPAKAGSHPSCTDPLPDISILASCPTPETGFDIGSPHGPHGLRGADRAFELAVLPALLVFSQRRLDLIVEPSGQASLGSSSFAFGRPKPGPRHRPP